MAARPAPAASVLLAALGIALAIGAAASFVAGAATAPAFHSGPDSELYLSAPELAATFALAMAIVIGLWVWIRADSASPLPARFVVVGLAILVIGILFVAILQVFGSPAGGFYGSAGNGTAPTNTSSGLAPTNGSLTGPGGVIQTLHLPGWALFAVIAGVVLVAAAVAVPRAWSWIARRERDGATGRPSPSEIEEVDAALAAAQVDLDAGKDPRAVVIALYGSLLRRVEPMVGGLDTQTPEEIRALHLERLGIRPASAEGLTRLFEEARYSTHPMSDDAVVRAQQAIAAAREDLDRAAPPLP
ncbi:MAG TPA: DUF4129 domain-containing protein [Thermoplasmata archaeon]|nr:DUF4129 domain-containing protein [Thermoplasmata archaeon]